MNNIRPR